MSFGGLLAIVVLILVVVSFVFASAVPVWLPLVLIGMLALAILLSAYPVRWSPPS